VTSSLDNDKAETQGICAKNHGEMRY